MFKLHERNAPDRLFITPDHRLFLIEFKRAGEKPRPEQKHEHDRLRARGFHVHVVDDREAGMRVIEQEVYGLE